MTHIIKRNNEADLWMLFLVWPTAGLFFSLKSFRENWAKNGLLLFIVFFGFTFVVQKDSDSIRYVEQLVLFHRSGISLSDLGNLLYTEGSFYIDLFQPIVTIIVAWFTEDPRILTAIFALVFGYFYTQNIWLLLDQTRGKLNIYQISLIVIFSMVVPFWFINGARFWTAAHVFLYGTLIYAIRGRTKGLWIVASSVFFHFSFVFPGLILAIYLATGRRRINLYFIFFIISFLFSEVNTLLFRDTLMAFTPEIFHERIMSYTAEVYMESVRLAQEELNWYVKWYTILFNYATVILLVFTYLKGREVWRSRTELLHLISFLLLLNGFVNIFSNVPSMGRFQALANLFNYAFMFLYFFYNHRELQTRRLFEWMTPAFLLFILVSLRIGFDYISVNTLITNPVIAPFLSNETALIDIFK